MEHGLIITLLHGD